MAGESRIFTIVLCVLVLLSMVPLINVGATTPVEIYGYVHLDDGNYITQLPNHLVTITNDETQISQEVYTDQYGYFSLMQMEPDDLIYSSTYTFRTSYYDHDFQNTIQGFTTMIISPCMRADPTFMISTQECTWYEDNEAPTSGFPPHSDITISKVTFSQEFAFEGDDVTICADVKNIGYSTLPDYIDVRFYDEETSDLIGEDIIPDLPADGTEIAQIEWLGLPPGTHTIDAVAGGQKLFAEISMTNNGLSSTFIVLTYYGDYDGDDLANWDEYAIIGTNPIDEDTDNDGLPDGWEYFNNLSPLNDGKIDPIHGPNGDQDGDGLINIYEYSNLFDSDNNPSTDPWNPDTDGDSFSDYEELNGILVNGAETSWLRRFEMGLDYHWYIEQTDDNNIFGLSTEKYISSPCALYLETTSDGQAYGISPTFDIDMNKQYSISFYFYLADEFVSWLEVIMNSHIRLVVDSDKYLCYMDGTSLNPIELLEEYKWYYIKCEANPSLSSYDIYIDDLLKDNDIPFYEIIDGMNNIRFGGPIIDQITFGKAYWDNIFVKYITPTKIAIIDPTDVDTDDDGLNDDTEINTYGTNPSNYDTDNDSFMPHFDFNDGVEVQYWEGNPHYCSPIEAGLRAKNIDVDQDQLSDGFEMCLEFDPGVYQLSNVKWKLDNFDNMHVVWQEEKESSQYEIYYKNNLNCPSGWNIELQITNTLDPALSIQPRFSLDNTNIYIEWLSVEYNEETWTGKWWIANSEISASYGSNDWCLTEIFNYDSSDYYSYIYPPLGCGDPENIFPEPLPYLVAINNIDPNDYGIISPITHNPYPYEPYPYQPYPYEPFPAPGPFPAPDPIQVPEPGKLDLRYPVGDKIKEYIEDYYPGKLLEENKPAYEYHGPIPNGNIIIAVLQILQGYEFNPTVQPSLPLPGDPPLTPPFLIDDISVGSDSDGDELSDNQEDFEFKTDKNDPDTDNDHYFLFYYEGEYYTLEDGDEKEFWNSVGVGVNNGWMYDFDGDYIGVPGWYPEGNNMLDPDSDGDNLPDGWELYYGFAPYDDGSNDLRPGHGQGNIINGPYGNPDNDGLTNYEEYIFNTDPTDPDTDGDGLYDGWIDANQDTMYNGDEFWGEIGDPDSQGEGGYGTDPINKDSDGDSLWDGWHDDNANCQWDGTETKGEIGDPASSGQGGYGTCPTATGYDDDGDSLIDEDPINGIDDDDDGFIDEDPNGYDTDSDELFDGGEIQYLGDMDLPSNLELNDDIIKNQLDPDSDGDGILDGREDYQENSDGDSGDPWCNALDIDSDGDGLIDSDEDIDKDGNLDWGETKPESRDSDNDRLYDGNSMYYNGEYHYGESDYETNPRDYDSDDDNFADGRELDYWKSLGENNWKSNYDHDTEKNNLLDFDSDSDGLKDGYEYGIYQTKPEDPDSDNDCLWDGWKDIDNNGAYNGNEQKGEVGDPDNNNIGGYGTDPNDEDTDGDKLNDYNEIYSYWEYYYIYDVNNVRAHWYSDHDEDGLKNIVDWDSDGDLINDMDDWQPAKYDEINGQVFLYDAIAVNNNIGVTVAIDYSTTSTIKPTINPVTIPTYNNLYCGPHVYFEINTEYSGSFNAIIKEIYSEDDLPGDDNGLRMYRMKEEPDNTPWEIEVTSEVVTIFDYVSLKVTKFSIMGVGDARWNDVDDDDLYDWEEMNDYGSNPNDPDTDKDGWNDGEEVEDYASDPTERNPFEYWGFTWGRVRDFFKSSEIVTNAQSTLDYLDLPNDGQQFQDIWECYFKATHGRTIRYVIKVSDYVDEENNVDQSKINKFTNICLWAKMNNAWLFPILGDVKDYDSNEENEFPQKLYYFIIEFATAVLNADPTGEAYKRILSYQVENEMNHPSHHDDWSSDNQRTLLSQGTSKIRQAEVDAGVTDYTPLTVNFNLDWERVWWSESVAYGKMIDFFNDIINDDGIVDIAGLDFYPGSWTDDTDMGYTVEESIQSLLDTVNDLIFDLQDQNILVTETGYSDKHQLSREFLQEDFYEVLTDSFKDYYWNQWGKDNGFLGVLCYELFDERDDDDAGWFYDTERNFGIIESTDEYGSKGSWDRGESPKLAWGWLHTYLTP